MSLLLGAGDNVRRAAKLAVWETVKRAMQLRAVVDPSLPRSKLAELCESGAALRAVADRLHPRWREAHSVLWRDGGGREVRVATLRAPPPPSHAALFAQAQDRGSDGGRRLLLRCTAAPRGGGGAAAYRRGGEGAAGVAVAGITRGAVRDRSDDDLRALRGSPVQLLPAAGGGRWAVLLPQSAEPVGHVAARGTAPAGWVVLRAGRFRPRGAAQDAELPFMRVGPGCDEKNIRRLSKQCHQNRARQS